MSSRLDFYTGFDLAGLPDDLPARVAIDHGPIHNDSNVTRARQEENEDEECEEGEEGEEGEEKEGDDMVQEADAISNISDVESDTGDTRGVVNMVKAQGPFQPGSTPMEATKRYLAYNLVGVIEVTDQGTHHIVNVVFHDQSKRAGYHFADKFRYNFASLGQRGAAFACQPDTSHAAHVLYKPYGTWAYWTYELRCGTSVVGVTAGGSPPAESLRKGVDIESLGNVVIATSEGELIFLSGGGVERTCLTLPGTFVTMVAGSEWVFLVTRDGGTTTDGSQNLTGRLIKFEDFCILQKENLPVPKHHTLEWVGITEEGAPAIYGSSGALSVMPHFRVPLRAMWMRILHTGQVHEVTGRGKSCWPVGVIGDIFFCLLLNRQQAYPGFPRPLLQELPIRLPFKQTDSEEARLEEHVIRETTLLHILRGGISDEKSAVDLAERELALDHVVVQLTRRACQSNCEARALDFARFLHSIPSIDVAIKVANSYHFSTLQRGIERLKAERGGPVRLDPPASHQPPNPMTINGIASMGYSTRKRPVDNVSSVDSDTKRRAFRESVPSFTPVDKNVLRQSRGNLFLQKPRTGASTLSGNRAETSRKTDWINTERVAAGG